MTDRRNCNLSTLSRAAAGKMGLCFFPQVNAVSVDAGQTLGAINGRIYTKEREQLGTVCSAPHLSLEPAVISCRLTRGQAVEANSDGGGLYREAARQATQHRLNRVASGFLAMDVYLLLQLHRFKLHTTLCKRGV